jgi:CRP-like cAMP-binding protein
MLDQNLVLRSLPPAVLERLKPRLSQHDFRPGQVLYATGDTIQSVCFPCSGAVSLVLEMANGQMVETALVGRDSVIGGGIALDGREAMHKAVTQVAGAGYMLDASVARQIGRESEEFRTAIFGHEQLLLAQAQQSAACNATHDLGQRLARWLLRVRDVTGQDSFGLTQEFMAQMLGVQRTSVSVIAHAMQESGFIRYRRGQLTIEQPHALEHMACECYAAVRTRYRPMATLLPKTEPTRTW